MLGQREPLITLTTTESTEKMNKSVFSVGFSVLSGNIRLSNLV